MSAITDSARGEICQLNLPGVCCGDPATTVWAHSNRYADGKGIGLKANDSRGCYACYRCHMTYDRQFARPAGMTLSFVENAFTRAMKQSQKILMRKKLWSGTGTAPATIKRIPKSKKIPVTGRSALQRMGQLRST